MVECIDHRANGDRAPAHDDHDDHDDMTTMTTNDHCEHRRDFQEDGLNQATRLDG